MQKAQPLSAAELKSVLEKIAEAGSLVNHPILKSWVVAEFLEQDPAADTLNTEFLIGQSLEYQLRLWSQEFPFNETFHDQWLKVFCLKYYYFQRKLQLAAYRKHPTLRQLGDALGNPDILSELVPGRESEAKRLFQAEELRSFWYSFASTILIANRAAEKLQSALRAFAEALESRQMHKLAQPANVSVAASVADADDKTAKKTSPSNRTLLPPSLEAETLSMNPEATPTSALPSPFSGLAAYKLLLDRIYPLIIGYRPPICQIESMGVSAPLAGDAAAHLFVGQYQTVVIRGGTGVGKTTFLAQAVIQAARQINLVPVWVSLPEYFTPEPIGDIPSFVSDHVFARWYPDLEDRGVFRRELSQAERDQRVIWLLDGYDELSSAQRARAIHDMESLGRFVLTARTSRPVLNRRIDAQAQLFPIDFHDALEFIDAAYSTVRGSIANWMHRNADVQRALGNGLILRQAAEVAQNSPEGLQLTMVLDKAITQQLMTHARFPNASDPELIKRTRLMLGKLAWQMLSPQRETALSRDQATDHELHTVWNTTTKAPEEPPYDLLYAAGLVSEVANYWRFWSDLICDELAAEYATTEQLIRSELAFYPQYQRVLSFWVAKQISDLQLGPAIELLRSLIADSEEDPYGARWMTIVAILKECRLFQHAELDSIRRQVEQALVALWNRTASNKLKAWITESLIAVGASSSVPAPDPALWEEVWPNFDAASPQDDLFTVLLAAGHSDLVKVTSGSPAYDNDITHALIDALLLSDGDMAKSAALHLRRRDLMNATVLEIEQSRRPIQRLVWLALLHPISQGASAGASRQMKTAQSLALAILNQPDILCNPGVLRWIPTDVVQMLMADLNLRIRLKDSKPMLITADGREHVLSGDVYVPWW